MALGAFHTSDMHGDTRTHGQGTPGWEPTCSPAGGMPCAHGLCGLGTGCSQARTHKPSPKTSRCGWHSTEGQTGPCSRLTHGTAASLLWPHTSPGTWGQPHEVPPTLLKPSCQALQGQDVSSHCVRKGTTGQTLHSEGHLPAMASSTWSHRTEPGLKPFPCLPRSLV